MISEKRKYHFIGELCISRSKNININSKPFEDKVNWLFLKNLDEKFSFVYKIIDPINSEYNAPFNAYLLFTWYEKTNEVLILNHFYEVFRGEEIIGKLKLVSKIDWTPSIDQAKKEDK